MGDRDSERDAGFAEFVRGAYASLLRTAVLLTGDRHAAEDLVQAALVRVYVRWNRSAAWESPQAYARKVVVNLFATWRKRRWNGEVPSSAERHVTDAGDMADGAARRLLVGRVLATLPRAQRAVVVLRFYEDLSVEQTAELLGCSPGTVKSRTNRALERLRASGVLAEYAGRGAR